MSFIYEEENLQAILNSAFSKIAQQVNSTVDPSLVKRLAERLNAELSPAVGDKYSPNTAGQDGAELKYNDLKFDNLLKFLTDNKLKFGAGNKDRIVYTKEDFNNPLSGDLAETDKENYDAMGNYFINPPALIDYVKYLQDKFQDQNNPLINARLRLLVDEVNQRLPGANLSRNPGKGEVAGPEFKDTDELDKVDSTFSLKDGVKEGVNVLTVGDLKTKESFNAWLQKHHAKIVSYDAKGAARPEFYSKAKNLKAAWDIIVKSLYDRASRLRDLATSLEIGKKYDYYKRLLVGLGASGVSGQGIGPNQLVNHTNQTDSSNIDLDFNRIIDSLPLSNDIDLFKINRFFDQLQKLYNSSSNQSRAGIINSYIDASKNAMNNLDNITNNLKIVKENTLPKDFAYFLRGSTTAYAPAINLLYSIVTNTRQAIATFYSDYDSRLNSDQKNKLINQTEFYYGKNRGLLNDLLRESSQIAR